MFNENLLKSSGRIRTFDDKRYEVFSPNILKTLKIKYFIIIFRKSENIPLSCNKLDANETKEKSLIDEATLRFRNVKMETAVSHRFFSGSFCEGLSSIELFLKICFQYHSQADQWFIPALAISIFYLVIYAVYHVLVLPRYSHSSTRNFIFRFVFF